MLCLDKPLEILAVLLLQGTRPHGVGHVLRLVADMTATCHPPGILERRLENNPAPVGVPAAVEGIPVAQKCCFLPSCPDSSSKPAVSLAFLSLTRRSFVGRSLQSTAYWSLFPHGLHRSGLDDVLASVFCQGPFQPENLAACLPDALEPNGRWVCSQSPLEVCRNFSVGHLRQLSSDCRQEVCERRVHVLVRQMCGYISA